jgi:hypothetical protein
MSKTMTHEEMKRTLARLDAMLGMLKRQLDKGPQILEPRPRLSPGTSDIAMTSTYRSDWSGSGDARTSGVLIAAGRTDPLILF